MARQARAYRGCVVGVLVAGGVLALVAVLVFGVAVLHGMVHRRPKEPLVTATAPPNTGVRPPPVRVLEPGERGPRPQRQLAGWARSMSRVLNIPRAALQAYGYAEAALAVRRPDCGISWTALAGIGRQESSHGRLNGARLDSTGRTTVPIIGPTLDGSPGVQRVLDTDDGRFDGDSQWDHAVGPLQFLPETWEKWGVDADGDGVADPNDFDDVALSAADYLCQAGGDLHRSEGWWNALLTYNQSRSYGQEVLDRADRYGRLSERLQ